MENVTTEEAIHALSGGRPLNHHHGAFLSISGVSDKLWNWHGMPQSFILYHIRHNAFFPRSEMYIRMFPGTVFLPTKSQIHPSSTWSWSVRELHQFASL
jgi:hypothetical protein